MTRRWLTSLAMVALLAHVGCSDSGGGGRFSPQPSFVSPGAPLVVEGPSSIAPGSSAQFRATVVEASGQRRDVTAEAHWAVVGTGLNAGHGGVVTAVQPGFGRVVAVAGLSRGEQEVAAVFPGTYVVQGTVRPQVRGTRARVEVLSGPHAGLAVDSDAEGRYLLAGVAGSLRVRASLLGHQAVEHDLVASAHLTEDFTLQGLDVHDPVGTWRLIASTSPSCTFQVRQAAATVQIGRDVTNGQTNLWIRVQEPVAAFFTATMTGAAFSAGLVYYDLSDFEYGVRLANPSSELLGDALAVVGDTRITGVVSGAFLDHTTSPPRRCQATDHAVVMTRMGA